MAGLVVLAVVIVVLGAFPVLRAPRTSLRFRLGAPVLWLALFAVGLALAAGVAGTAARAAGGACLIVALTIALSSERIRFEPLARARRSLVRRVKPVLFFIVGNWEDDVGFAGDGRSDYPIVVEKRPTNNDPS